MLYSVPEGGHNDGWTRGRMAGFQPSLSCLYFLYDRKVLRTSLSYKKPSGQDSYLYQWNSFSLGFNFTKKGDRKMKVIQKTIGEHAVLTGYLHEPSQEMGNISAYPAMLVLPGGGFRFCSEREGEPVAMAFFAEGYQAFVLDYTTVTKKPDAVMGDPMKDTELALKYLRDQTEEWHIAPGKVAMIGFSGGGHLAAAVATHGEERPDALVLGYPGIIHSDLRALDCPDIVESVDSQTPPSFIFSTRDDKVTPPAHPLAFAQALNTAGVDFELHIFRSGVHGLSLGKTLTSSGFRDNVNADFAGWFPMCVRWLRDRLGDFTIYGVNDGRTGKYSIDTVLSELLASAEAKALVLEAFPAVEGMAANPMAGHMSLRQIKGMLPGVSEEVLGKLDEALLKL